MKIEEKLAKQSINRLNISDNITGILRANSINTLENLCEKSKSYLKSIDIKEEQIIHINLEDAEYDFQSYKELYNYINDLIKDKNKKYYVFLDEVQSVDKFQKAVDSLYIKKNVDVYITGSNAYLLSGELATLLSGRYIEIKMLPLSFKEYVSAFDDNNYQQLFLDYMKNGGMPGNISILKSNYNDIDKYLDGIFSTIVYKDIMAKNNITDKILLESVLKFIFDSIGSPISTKKISDTLSSKGKLTSNHTVENYITAFLESFLIYKAERFDVKGKNLLVRDYKYYAVDTGLRSYLLGKKSDSDMGHILENIVYLELLRRGYKVYVGKVDDLEVDFVAENRDGLKYYQVALSVRDNAVLERELKSLQKTKDHYPKILLTLDMDLETDYEGITKINVVDWLLHK